ncbi:MAG: hypothetical protein AAF602_25505 [Myxococcota bacterium]
MRRTVGFLAGLGLTACGQSVPEAPQDRFDIDEVRCGQLDAFVAGPPVPVDMLLVVDNGPDMADVHADLGRQAEDLIRGLEGLDPHIAVAPFVTDDAPLVANADGTSLITARTPDAATSLSELIGRVGTGRDVPGDGLLAVFRTLEADDASVEAFRREEANLDVVLVTDQDDRSDDSGFTTDEFVRWFDRQSAGMGGRALHVVAPLDTGTTSYLRASDDIGGLALSLPLLQDGGFLEQVASTADRTVRALALTQLAAINTVLVRVDPSNAADPEYEWRFDDRNNIVFIEGVDPGDDITVEYCLRSDETDP